jgi:soluble P-type ATPase
MVVAAVEDKLRLEDPEDLVVEEITQVPEQVEQETHHHIHHHKEIMVGQVLNQEPDLQLAEVVVVVLDLRGLMRRVMLLVPVVQVFKLSLPDQHQQQLLLVH